MRAPPLWGRFYVRLAALFLALLVVLGAALGALAVGAADGAAAAADQALNRDLAAALAPRFAPHLEASIDTAAIRREIDGVLVVNRRIDVYLLGPNGMVKADFVDARGRPLAPSVPTGPLDRLLAGAPPPVLGEDPARPGTRRPFSVAPIRIMGEDGCYLYVILEGSGADAAEASLRRMFLAGAARRALALALALTAVVGLLAFAGLTRRLRRLAAAVGALERGAPGVRADDRGRDELAALGAAFNAMAGRIEAQVAALERTDRARRELVANASHDLRSPLAALHGYLETLQLLPALSAGERAGYVDAALRSAGRLRALVDELFELARLDAPEFRPTLEPAALADLAHDVVGGFGTRAAERGVALHVRPAGSVPLVRADVALVERALTNLLDNALRHTPASGAVEVSVEGAGPDHVAVAVRDTGEGIGPGALPHVFERFYRADPARPADGGGGLGLAIVRRVAQLHGGDVRVESTPGAGAAFTLVLPVGGPV